MIACSDSEASPYSYKVLALRRFLSELRASRREPKLTAASRRGTLCRYFGGCAMRLLLAVVFFVASSEALLACTGCGCRGGPGYRGPDGRCVGWKQLNSKCGNPPTTRCTFERKGDAAIVPGPTQGPYTGSVTGGPLPPPPVGPAPISKRPERLVSPVETLGL